MLLSFGLNDRFSEAAVFIYRGFIVTGNRCFYSPRGGGRHDFKSTDKNTHDLSWCWIDGERQDLVDEATRHDVDEATAFFEPGVLPSLHHGVGFVSINPWSKPKGTQRDVTDSYRFSPVTAPVTAIDDSELA